MSVIDELVFDRTASDVERVTTLKQQIMTYGFNSLSASERQEYLAGMKGAYNYTDMNRVGTAVQYLANRLINAPDELDAYRAEKGVSDDPMFDLPYEADEIEVSPKTDWSVSDIPTQSQAAIYLGNISNLWSILTLPSETPSPPASLNALTFTVANNIEKILAAIDEALSEAIAEKKALIDLAGLKNTYSGEAYSGEF